MMWIDMALILSAGGVALIALWYVVFWIIDLAVRRRR